MSRIYVALDVETTGLTERDAILEIGAVKFRDDDVLDTWSSFVNPGRAIPHKISRLTGITQRDVDTAAAWKDEVSVGIGVDHGNQYLHAVRGLDINDRADRCVFEE